MSEVEKEISKLLYSKGQNGPDMTHALKLLGNDDMQNGFRRIAEYFAKEGEQKGFKSGERSGFIKGATGAMLVVSAVTGIVYTVKQRKQKKEHEEEGKRILHVLHQAVSDGVKQREELEVKEGQNEKEV